MTSRNRWIRLQTAFALLALTAAAWTTHSIHVQAADSPEASFEKEIQPFLEKHCVACHNTDNSTAGVRVDHLDGKLPDRNIRTWEGIRRRVANQTMPPKGLPQPDEAERKRLVEWAEQALEVARLRPSPKNGGVRRLTVEQYQNTLSELLRLDDKLIDTLPPDAISKDGFVNNTETLQLSPLLMEAYFEIAEDALDRALVDPDSKPKIQNFRMDLGAGINPEPLPEKLILGANSLLLDNEDYTVTQLTAKKDFPFEPFFMRTQYRFIEGYEGNATVRGWRDFDSIYHAVFADMRGSRGYPKGLPYSTVPEGLLLRPAIPTDELFGSDGTYGPKANFKISLRELPDHGRFRVKVTAAKYDDGLLLDPEDAARPAGAGSLVVTNPTKPQTIEIAKAGVYQVDVVEAPRSDSLEPDASRLEEALAGSWTFDGEAPGKLEGDAKLAASPFGKALTLDGDGDSLIAPRTDALNVGEGDFTVAAWIRPSKLQRAGVVVLGAHDQMPGWRLELADNKGSIRLAAMLSNQETGDVVTSPQGVVQADNWQHIAAVVRRGKDLTRLYVNGVPVVKGTIGPMDLENTEVDLHIGRISYANHFQGEIDEVRLYTRALEDAELQALVEPGKELTLPPPDSSQEIRLSLGDRWFSGELTHPAFLAVRLDAGPLEMRAENNGVRHLGRIVLTPLADSDPVVARLRSFEQRSPRLGVHLGLRRDCGSTFAPVGEPQTVSGEELQEFVFEGAIANYPSPEVEKDNVNYLAGIREIAVRSEYTDGRDMPRLRIRTIEFEGPFYETWPPPSHQSVFVESSNKDNGDAYAREVIGKFASRAYRRPVTAEEEQTLFDVYKGSLETGRGFRESVKDALHVALTSPQFLFLVERSATPGPEPLDDYELASKLSYFLWNGPPDAQTLNLASEGKLRANLGAEVDRMIDDEKFSRFAHQFVSHWLSLDKLDVLEPDREKFPKLTRDARAQLRLEPIEFLFHLVRKNLPVRNLIDSDFVMVNEVVADYYDLGAKTESGFRFVPIEHTRPELGGVLTQAAILAGLSDGRESNPVKRGAWVARKIVAEPPADPPPNVPALDESAEGLTLRQRLEQHRNQPGCQQCHLKIDPWGVALEEFDANGRLKTEPADAESTLPDGSEVKNIFEFKRYLGDDRIDQVAFSVLKHLVIYANGRDLTYSELHALQQDGLRLRADSYRMRDMIHYVANSDLFLEK